MIIRLIFSLLLCGVNWPLVAHSSDAPGRLHNDAGLISRLRTVREKLIRIAAIPVEPASMQRLIERLVENDREAENQLDRWTIDQQSTADTSGAEEATSLRRQISQLWITRVELAVLQSELFADGSAEAIAAANSAAELAQRAIKELPAKSIARREVIRLLAEAKLRAGDATTAMTLWRQATLGNDSGSPDTKIPRGSTSAVPGETDDRYESLAIRIAINRRQWREARQRLDRYYGNAPESAPVSPSIDLARLQWLVLAPDFPSIVDEPAARAAAIADWLDAIERRSGSLARARGETFVARTRQRPSAEQSALNDDPRLQIADGRYQLRTGQPQRAAMTLARSAITDPNTVRSLKTASQSAAILVSQQQVLAAAELLITVASGHPESEAAAPLALQAAGLLTTGPESKRDPAKATGILQQILSTWPATPAGRDARDWLINIASADDDSLTAAELAIALPREHWTDAAAQRCEVLWQIAAGIPVSRLPWNDFGDSMINPAAAAAVEDWQPTDLEAMLIGHRRAAAEVRFGRVSERLRQRLSSVETSAVPPEVSATLRTLLLDDANDTEAMDWIAIIEQLAEPELRSLAKFRRNGDATVLYNVTFKHRDRAVAWRLERDAQLAPPRRAATAAWLLQQADATRTELPMGSRWRLRVWAGEIQTVLEQLAAPTTDPRISGPDLAIVAFTLDDALDAASAEHAAALWDQLAGGSPKSSPGWAVARVRAVEAWSRAGKHEAAAVAARYLLETSPPSDPALRKRLATLAN